MSEKKIFGLTEKEVKRQLESTEIAMDPERKFDPLSKRDSLDSCIEGGKKILKDPHMKEMLGSIYRGS